MQKINIYGSGQTAMIAALILRKDFDVSIISREKEIKQTHFALLRFKTKAVEEATGIKCAEVDITKNIFYNGKHYSESNIMLDNMYSMKVTGKIEKRSIGNLAPGKRYIPPVDFFQQLVEKTKKKYLSRC